MELQTIKIATNTESNYKPVEKQDLSNKNSFSEALGKVTTKDKPVDQKVDKTPDTKSAGTNVSLEKDKPLEEISNLDPSLQDMMALLQAFISGKINLETLLKGVTKDIKEIVEQKDPTGGIKQLSLELMKGMESIKQNENINKELPSILMKELQSYIKTLESEGKNKIGSLGTSVTLEDKIKSEISNIVLNTLKEKDVNVTSTTQGIKVVNTIIETKVMSNKSNIEVIENPETTDDVNKAKVVTAEESTMSSEKNPLPSQKSSMSNEERLLKSIIASDKEPGNKDTSIAKATNFISQFESLKNEKITPETLVINKNNFSADIVKSVKFMEINNLKNLTVTIAPKELGEVIIKLTMYGGTMKASITATNKEAYNILNSNLTDITNKLNNLDLKIQDFTLNIYNGDTTFFKQGSKGENLKDQNNKNPKDSVKEVGEISLESDVDVNSSSSVNMLA